MRSPGSIAIAALLLAACGTGDVGDRPAPSENKVSPAAAPAGQPGEAPRWDLQSSGEGVALALLAGPDRAVIRLFCPARQDRLLVNVPGFSPVGSEERLSFGSGAQVVALVAAVRGDPQSGGVSAAGVFYDDIKDLHH